MTTFVFPGQGSQKKGMGGGLFDDFGELTAKADAILGYSVRELCLRDPGKQLDKTQYTQVAMYVVNALMYLRRIEQTGQKPDYVAGHSLGEYDALFAAGAFDFETGLQLVKRRGELMGQASGGAMAAVVGLSREQIEETLQKNGLTSISIANLNTLSQTVIAGNRADIDQAGSTFEAAGAQAYIPLNVSGAFHTPGMSAARAEFERSVNGLGFSEPTIPVMSNVHARPYREAEVKRNLVEQITSPVRWRESILYLMRQGEMEFEEIGPGTVLTRLIAQIQTESTPLNSRKARVGAGRVSREKQVGHARPQIISESLGSEEFRKEHNVKYAYAAGGMYKGIASKELVVRMGRAGLMAYFGTGGLAANEIEKAIQYIQHALNPGQPYGMNLLCNHIVPNMEEEAVDLFLRYGVRNVEASAFMEIKPSLVRYRLKGLSKDGNGRVSVVNRIQAKVSRPEVAEAFLSPAPERIIEALLVANMITQDQAALSREVPVADDLCVEADSAGHTDQGVAYALMPAMLKLRDAIMEKYGYSREVRVGAAGGIGAPEAAAAAFVLGAEFIVTGSINQCTVEAGTSDAVKDLLEQANVQDTEYAPAADMFEMGTRVQVLKKGLFFPARARKLYDLYRQHSSLDDIDNNTRKQLEERYFKRTLDEIYEEAKNYYPTQDVERAERDPKARMAIVFRWYFHHASDLALSGNEERKVDYQIPCGPALGAFNQWVKGTALENWRNRHIDEIAGKLMRETAELLNRRFQSFM
jgi:trans-AT polyketide synthase/acyltransferase/oxidoreductase domain-containing protein